MFKNKKLNLALFIIGLLIVIVAVASWFLFPEWRTTPHGLIQLIGIVTIGVVGLLADFTQVLSYFRPQPPADAGPTAVSQGENAQSVVGDHNRSVQTGGGDYIENQIVQPAPPEAPAPAPLFDVLPPSAAAGYVARGVEAAVEAALLGRQGQPLALLHGPHGIGKTETALQISRRLSGEFEYTLWIPLGSRPTDQVLLDYLRACGIKPPERKEEQIQALKAWLAQHRLLIVLDDLCAQQSADLEILLPPSPCAALLTSCIQQPSHLIPVNHSFPLEQMDREHGHALLENVLNGTVLSAEPEAVDDLIVKCAGNPLALEIAARRIQFMQGTPCPIQAYLEKLNKSLGELRSGHDPRLDLFAVFDQTYTSLSPAEQLGFRTLSVCAPAGFSAEAAQALWQIDPAPFEEILWQLRNVYFLKPVLETSGRFRLHDLLHEYASSKLTSDERKVANLRLSNWLISLFTQHHTDDISNAPVVALELDNLRQAVAWATQNQNGELLARLATKPRNWLMNYFCNYEEWLAWLQNALSLKISDKSLEGWIYLSIGGIQQVTIHNENAFTAYSTAIDLFRAANDPQGEANSQFAIGEIQLLKTQTDEAFGSFTAALNSFRSLGDLLGEANSLQMIGDIYQIKGNAKDALSSLQDAVDLFLSIGDQLGEANTIMSMGETYAANNENDLALHSYETALHLFHSTGSFRGEANTLAALSRLLVHEGKISEAEQKLREGADLRKQIQDSFDEATDNGNFAIVLLEQKEFTKAAFYAQRARSLFQSISITDRVEKMTRLIDKIQEKSKVFTNS